MTKAAADPTDFKPMEYWLGCHERLAEATQSLAAGRHGPALMLAGVAAECAIRSMYAEGAAFDGRHDMRELLNGISVAPSPPMAAAAGTLRVLWRNNYRYMGPDQLRRVIKATRRYPRLTPKRGLEQAAVDAMEATHIIVQRARYLWRSRNI